MRMMKKYGFVVVSLLLIIVIVLAMPGKKSFRHSAREMLDEVQGGGYIISISRYKELADSAAGTVLVDLRSSGAFQAAHLPGAVNFPAEESKAGTAYDYFDGIKGDVILYSDETSLAGEWWILLTQMGIDNLLVLDTGSGLDRLILNWESENEKNVLIDEVPLYTFVPDTAGAIQ